MRYYSLFIKISVLFLLSAISTSFSLKPDTSDYKIKPNYYALMYKEFKITTDDNLDLNLWLYPSQIKPQNDSIEFYYKNKNITKKFNYSSYDTPTIIICNGDGGNMSHLLGLAINYCTRGYNVITFDWRGYGKSDYFPIDTNYVVIEEFIKDYNAVVNFIINNKSLNQNKLGAFGFSTGAFFTYAAALSNPEIKAIAIRGIFTDYASTIQRLIKINPNDTYDFPKSIDNYSPLKTWHKFTKPIFLIVGEYDIITPPSESQIIYKNINSINKKIWIVEDAKHGGINAPEAVKEEQFYKRTINFFNKHLN